MFKLKTKAWGAALTGAAVLSLTVGMTTPALAATPVHAAPATYQLTVAGHVTTLTEGETVVYPMIPVASAATKGVASPDVVYPGDGTGTLTVTASAGVYHYGVAMHIPATNFIGHFSTVDLTSGFSGGSVLELVFSGSVPTSKLHGHRYSGTLTGSAQFLGTNVATVGPNATLYKYP